MNAADALRFNFSEYCSLDMYDRAALDRIEESGSEAAFAKASADYGVSIRKGGPTCARLLFTRPR